MPEMMPPLNALRAFEAAARLLSFTKAADELRVTPGAISQQIRQLEDFYGMPLFRRTTRTLIITESAQAVMPLVRDAFDKLHQANERLSRQTDDATLTISTSPSMGQRWLLPRLESFRSRHPDIDIRIDATDRLADLSRDGIDMAIRYGRGNYPGLVAEALYDVTSFPVCSPVLLEGEHPLCHPDDLKYHTLIHLDWRTEPDETPTWRMWLEAAGVKNVDPTRGLTFSADSLALQAVQDGLGVALSSMALAGRDLENGKLVQPFSGDLTIKSAFKPYLVYQEGALQTPKVAAFRDWALEEAGRGDKPA